MISDRLLHKSKWYIIYYLNFNVFIIDFNFEQISFFSWLSDTFELFTLKDKADLFFLLSAKHEGS